MAEGLPDQTSPLAVELLRELDRARVVDDRKVGAKTIRIGSRLVYKPDNGAARTITLVSPDRADIAQNRISVMTPIGAALIGLSEGQTIDWTDRSGVEHLLVVEAVDNTGIGQTDGSRG